MWLLTWLMMVNKQLFTRNSKESYSRGCWSRGQKTIAIGNGYGYDGRVNNHQHQPSGPYWCQQPPGHSEMTDNHEHWVLFGIALSFNFATWKLPSSTFKHGWYRFMVVLLRVSSLIDWLTQMVDWWWWNMVTFVSCFGWLQWLRTNNHQQRLLTCLAQWHLSQNPAIKQSWQLWLIIAHRQNIYKWWRLTMSSQLFRLLAPPQPHCKTIPSQVYHLMVNFAQMQRI